MPDAAEVDSYGRRVERPPNALLKAIQSGGEYTLLLLTMCGALLAVLFSVILANTTDIDSMPRRFEMIYLLGFPGMLFLRTLQMIVIPLVMASIVHALGNMDIGASGKIGLRTFIYFFVTTLIATIVGIVLAVIVNPGKSGKAARRIDLPTQSNPNFYTLLDTIRNVFPTNLFGAFLYQEKVHVPVDLDKPLSSQIESTMTTNIMGLLFVSIMAGILLARISRTPEGILILGILDGLNRMLITGVHWIIWLTPVGVLSLLMDTILRSIRSLSDLGISMGWYILVVVLALSIILFIVYQALYFGMTRTNPFKFFSGMMQAWITGMATSSSSATLPLTMYCLEKNNGVDERISSFVASLGATVNMNGTACYEAVAAIYLAGMSLERSLSVGDYIIISLTATLAGVGAAAIPSAGLVTMIMVLDSIGVDSSTIAFILPVDFILDRLRTGVNIMGDAYGAGIINHHMKDDLEELDRLAARERENLLRSQPPDDYTRASRLSVTAPRPTEST
ncbi:unnamed protein product [Notodromas monacha]|uniref:Amino acid transporter n=1 Tax=Notodromas monacha TaxID=399045 RepID=A0A7R9BMN6_9CRUS|nr:unnamed protein product [Notodromas monacha]CAG0917498.1 unnamed protein product [Notodromas monacha]